ncbi:sodium:solute symporter [Rubrivirga sp. IMCC43871]|uniref:sodium:solute symporter n=1 Tax=Rubrivirga sp. IMCC43871 TaxID=3391575 RepID=UPI00398FAD59
MPDFALTTLDITAVVIYAIVIFGIGLWFSRQTEDGEDYFLAGRSLSWGLIGISLLASNLSSSSMIGMAGEAYGGIGLAVFNYEWMAAMVLVVFVLFFLPFYIKTGIYTMPEFLEKRFDGRSRVYFSAMSIFLSVVVDTAAALFAGALVIELVYPDFPMWMTMAILALIAGAYTIAGGLKAVVYTDAIQGTLLLIGAGAVSVMAWNAIGGWDAVTAVTPAESLSLVQSFDLDPDLPWYQENGMTWLSLMTGVFLLGFYFWTTNQFMVQRVLGAKNLDHGRWGALFGGLLKLPILFLMVMPGTFARVLYPNLERADQVFPTLLFDLLPGGFRALVLTAMLAAIMSSVDSTLNAASTLVTMDFIKRKKPDTSPRALVRWGRIVTFLCMVFAIAWSPVIVGFDTLWSYLQTTLAYVAPPALALFIVGVFWKRANGTGAIAGMAAGHLTAVLFLIGGPIWTSQTGAPLAQIFNVNFLYLAPLLLAVAMVVMVVVSLQGEAPAADKTDDTTWTLAFFRAESAELASVAWWKNYRIQSAILVTLTAILVGFFW